MTTQGFRSQQLAAVEELSGAQSSVGLLAIEYYDDIVGACADIRAPLRTSSMAHSNQIWCAVLRAAICIE